MHRLLSSLLGSSKKSSKKKGPRPSHKRPLGMGLESLEGRKLMAGIPMQWAPETMPKAAGVAAEVAKDYTSSAAPVGTAGVGSPAARSAAMTPSGAVNTQQNFGTLTVAMTPSPSNTSLNVYKFLPTDPVPPLPFNVKINGEIMTATAKNPSGGWIVQRAVNSPLQAHRVGDQVFVVPNNTQPPVNTTPPPVQPPSAPANLRGTTVSPTQANLTWNASAGATSYVVQQLKNNAWVTINTVSGTSLSVNGLSPGSSNNFRVAAVNAGGTSAFNTATVVTQPVAPTNFIGKAVSPSQVNLTWSPSAGATSYVVQQLRNNAWVTVGNVSGTSASVTGLGAASTTSFRVAAVNAAGPSAYTGQINVLTWPAAPTNFTARTVSNSQINLSWNAVGGATGYWVYVQAGQGASTLYQTLSAGQTNVTVNGLSSSVSYTFHVAAFNSAGHTFANPISAAAQVGVPATPTNFTVRATTSAQPQALLSWNAAAGATSYQVYMYTTTGWQRLSTTAATSIYLNLQPRTTYYFSVSGLNAAGESPGAAAQSITTK